MYDIRIVDLPEKNIYYNMALDEALFLCADKNNFGGTLRFYQNKKYSVSLGYFQNIDEINLDFLHNKKIDYVRRITGGRAVLHGDDLTFSFIGGVNSPFFDLSTVKITNKFAKIIKKALKKINVIAQVNQKTDQKKSGDNKNFYCFGSVNRNEIIVDDKKIVGYALKRSEDSFLLQGSILFDLDEKLYLNIVKGKSGIDIKEKIACINDYTKNREEIDSLKKAIVSTFIDEGYKVFADELTMEEKNLLESLKRSKYKDTAWTKEPKRFAPRKISIDKDEERQEYNHS